MASKKRVSKTVSIPAPTGGLNARDPLANMDQTEAVTMENVFPEPSGVTTRKGYREHVTGITGNVETLLVYNNGTTKKLFGVADGEVYDCTTSGAAGSAVVSSLSNSRFQYVNMGTAGGFYLMAVNGEDKLQYYDGSSWDVDGGGTYSITNVDTADCIHINNFKNRIWLIEKDSFNAWYLPVSSIAGAASNLDLSGLFKLGGYLVAMANWTIDNAAGIDDYAVFITSQGEVALYKGTDPSSASTWALVGTFRMGRPLGRRCFTKAGADVLVLTTDGAFPLSKALLTDRTQLNLAATDKISNLINNDVRDYSSNFGWQPIIYPSGNKLIINVPTSENNTSIQYVMNTITGAWCKFKKWDAFVFDILDDDLYFGGDGAVYQADVGFSDNGSNIVSVVQQAYGYFGSRGVVKKFQMARPILISQGSVVPAIIMSTDFQEKRTEASSYVVGSSGSEWDVATWDEASWASEDILTANWQSLSGIGISGGIKILTSLNNVSCKWVSTDIVYETGGLI